MNDIARLEYDLAYYDSAVHRFNHYTTTAPPGIFWERHYTEIVDEALVLKNFEYPFIYRLGPRVVVQFRILSMCQIHLFKILRIWLDHIRKKIVLTNNFRKNINANVQWTWLRNLSVWINARPVNMPFTSINHSNFKSWDKCFIFQVIILKNPLQLKRIY